VGDFTEVSTAPEAGQKQSHVRRRGLIAGAAALAVGVFTRSSEVSAADGGAMIIGASNTSTTQTQLIGAVTGLAAFRVTNNYNLANPFDTTKDAIQGFAAGATNIGVLGRNDDLNGVGLYGIASNGTGIAGQSIGGSAVSGNSTSGAGAFLSSQSGNGASGLSTSGVGVFGNSNTNIGVYGISNASGGGGGGSPYGVVGAVTASPGFGIFGLSTIAGTVAFAGGASVVGAIAAQFSGPVNIYNTGPGVSGDLVVQNNLRVGGSKNAFVAHPDGTHRLLYCVESPEAWFEDFGEATVSGGSAVIALDADFAAVVDTSKLHVFITETGGHAGLHISAKSASGFTVNASEPLARAAGTSTTAVTGTFSYRVVAKRKDIVGERLAKFVVPKEIKAGNGLPKVPTSKIAQAPARHPDGGVTKG